MNNMINKYKERKIFILLLLLVLVAIIFFIWTTCKSSWCLWTEGQKARLATNFETCLALGLPVSESYPRQCRVGLKVFTEEIIDKNPNQELFVGNEKIKIFYPMPETIISSPVDIKGEARGNWYFEGSFPVRLLDANGKELAILPVQAQDEWMTTEFVPFIINLSFKKPTTTTGTLVFQKDNPSGLSEYDESFSIPIVFK